jgi:hypothetical protein
MRISKNRLLFLILVKGGEILDGNIPVLKRKNILKRIISRVGTHYPLTHPPTGFYWVGG